MTTKKSPGLSPAERIRIGRDEREGCVDDLQEHYAAGRLGDQELADRVGAALTATTRADLRMLLADLPGARVQPADRSQGRAFWITISGALLVGVLGLGAIDAAGEQSPTSSDGQELTTCLSTGEMADPANACPDVSDVQQQIFADADAADRAAQQLQVIAERNPDVQLNGLLERASASSGRARDAAENSRQIVLVAHGEPAEKLLAGAAQTGKKAADETQKTLDVALDRLDG